MIIRMTVRNAQYVVVSANTAMIGRLIVKNVQNVVLSDPLSMIGTGVFAMPANKLVIKIMTGTDVHVVVAVKYKMRTTIGQKTVTGVRYAGNVFRGITPRLSKDDAQNVIKS